MTKGTVIHLLCAEMMDDDYEATTFGLRRDGIENIKKFQDKFPKLYLKYNSSCATLF